MALVIFFVPDPDNGVAEMARVVRPGGTVATYVWDMMGGGHPLELMHAEIQTMGFTSPRPPRSDVSDADSLRHLWRTAGFDAVEVREITVQRTFADFEEFWMTSMMAATVSQTIQARLGIPTNRALSRARSVHVCGFTVADGARPHGFACSARRPS